MARNVWSDRPLGVKLAALVAAGATVLAVFALITVQALDGTGETAEQLLAGAEATEDVLLADMMHDAVAATSSRHWSAEARASCTRVRSPTSPSTTSSSGTSSPRSSPTT
jgi:phage shock protein A